MPMPRWAAVVCALAAVPILSPPASAQHPAPAVDAGKPAPAARVEGTWPVVLTRNVSDDPAAQPPEWSAKDIEDGRARCAALLRGLDLVAEPIEPIREGAACGTPAPMQLVSVGSSPKVTFSPPATLTCDMIAAMHKWLQQDVQPLARQHLGAAIVEVATMSSFSCRNAYGRAKNKLSEHGRVNAIDIGTFVTERGEKTMVLADWGPVARELAAEAKAESVKRQAEAAAATRKAKPPAEGPRVATPDTVKSYQAGTSLPIGMPRITFGIRMPDAADDLSSGLGWAPPSRLGGPKQPETVAPGSSGKAEFLRAIHKAACTIFATVLGPEANKVHKNHFHLDMAERRSANICE